MSIRERFSSFSNKISLENKDPNVLDNESLTALKKNDSIGLLLDVVNLILMGVIFYFVNFYGFQFISFTNVYTYNLFIRENAIIIAYSLNWIGIVLTGMNLMREVWFFISFDEKVGSAERKFTLTVSDEEEKHETRPKIGENFNYGEEPVEKFAVRIFIYLAMMAVLLVEMIIYLPFNQRFPSFQIVVTGFGQIAVTEYYIFLLIVAIFLIMGLFLLFYDMMGLFSRRRTTEKILFIRFQTELFDEVREELREEYPEEEIEDKLEEIKGRMDKNFEDIDIEESEPQKDEKSKPSIWNTPVDKLKERKLRLIRFNSKVKYLEERKKLLQLIREEKLKNLYGKKQYKQYKKKAKGKGKNTDKSDIGTASGYEGYEVVPQNSADEEYKEPDIGATVKEKIARKAKKKKKKKKRKSRKRSYDFR
mgnify:CR=1 FL=1